MSKAMLAVGLLLGLVAMSLHPAGARDLSAAKAPAPNPSRPSVATLVAEAARAPTPAASIALLKQAHAEAPTPVVATQIFALERALPPRTASHLEAARRTVVAEEAG
ncbi:g7058 [Coccomyxa viridis]|uniref:G7058 protein n=1 Tax=Coccomyxa viridis TaxID=1274662 RepID=A0ABP1FY34_9CHLO